MGKVLKIGLAIAGIAVAFVPGVGPALTGAIYGLTGGAIGATAATVLAIGQAVTATVGILGVTTALGLASKALGLGPKAPKVNRDTEGRLHATVEPSAPRKLIFGRTALATDIRYQAFTGTDKEYYWQVVCNASHYAEQEELWLDDKQAWTASGGVTSTYAGYLTVTAINEGNSGNVQSIDSQWGPSANTRLTGCAYLVIRYKLTGNSKKVESPFAQSVPTRMTVIGKGLRVYDPRRDSTVGGSGSMRANDQTTWAYSAGGVDIGRNPALQMLTWLLGWKINGKLAVGRGVKPNRIDFDSFMAAANLCEESVALAAGGTEPRYCCDGIFAEDEDGGSILTAFSAAMNGVLRDNGGKLALSVLHNDLATPIMSLSDDDVMGPFDWQQTQPLEHHRNIVRGRYTDPSANSLYQLVDYPQISIASPDGLDRILTLDLPGVQSPAQAQRLAKSALQRLQYGGVLTVPINARGWALLVGDVVEWTLTPLGFTNKLFRLVERTIRFDGISECVFAEEHADIYAWDAEESPPVVPAAPINYDWQKHPLILANIEDNADVTQLIKGSALSSVACDYTGTPKTGVLPLDVNFKLVRGTASTDVTTSATWSASLLSGSATFTIGSGTGTLNVTALSSSVAEIEVQAVYNGVTRKFVHKLEKALDAPPVGGGSGSGASSTSVISSTSSSSYGSANTSVLTCKAGSGGQVVLSAPLDFYRTSNGTGDCYGKWQWRVVGGVFADVTTEIHATVTAFKAGAPEPANDPGSIAVNMTKSGLTAGTDYEFQLLLRTAGSYTLTFSGTASAVGV